MIQNHHKRIYSDPFYATTTITLEKLAKVLGVPLGELIEEAPDDMREKSKRKNRWGLCEDIAVVESSEAARL